MPSDNQVRYRPPPIIQVLSRYSHLPEREIITGICPGGGAIAVRACGTEAESASHIKFKPAIQPLHAWRFKKASRF